MPSTLLDAYRAENDQHWTAAILRKWAKTLTGDTINVVFVDDATMEENDAVAIYRPADKIRTPRIELKGSLVYNPTELLRSYFHELAHHQQRQPAFRRKSWMDEERDAENFGRNMERKVRDACKRNKTSVADLFRYPDED